MGKALKSQEVEIIEHIRDNGSITTMEAFEKGITRLASRVYDMRAHGVNVVSEMVTVKNRKGEDCRVARYFIKGGVPSCFSA